MVCRFKEIVRVPLLRVVLVFRW